MRRNGVHFLVAAGLALTALLPAEALAQGAIKLGELNSYKVFPAFLDPYRKGIELEIGRAHV